MNDTDREELRLLAERLLAIAEIRAALQPPSPVPPAEQARIDDQALATIAARELKRRALRSKHLPACLFGEGGWSILLDLFVSHQKGREVSVKSACIASQVPSTTALRYIALLVEQGLITTGEQVEDKRMKLLKLTDKGLSAVRCVLREYS